MWIVIVYNSCGVRLDYKLFDTESQAVRWKNEKKAWSEQTMGFYSFQIGRITFPYEGIL